MGISLKRTDRTGTYRVPNGKAWYINSLEDTEFTSPTRFNVGTRNGSVLIYPPQASGRVILDYDSAKGYVAVSGTVLNTTGYITYWELDEDFSTTPSGTIPTTPPVITSSGATTYASNRMATFTVSVSGASELDRISFYSNPSAVDLTVGTRSRRNSAYPIIVSLWETNETSYTTEVTATSSGSASDTIIATVYDAYDRPVTVEHTITR